MIGIDLGTTNSLVAVFENGTPRILANELGEDLTPSVVAVAEDGTVLVGRAAKDRLIMNPESGIAAFKRDMGTDATYQFGGDQWTPITCSALVLQEMKRIAEMRLGRTVDRAVITVPAYFHDPQRQATIEAASLAGLTVDRIINEPTAAALAYGYRNPEEETKLLIFDLGGGTFDVTLLEIFEGVIEVKASAGESRLGGEDYTDHFATYLEKKHSWSPAKHERGAWRSRVEAAKRKLSKAQVAGVYLDEKMIEVTRADLDAASVPLQAKLRPVISRCLRDGFLKPEDLNAVLMVGGASRMEMVRDFVRESLKNFPNQTIDPDRVVAMGAAIQAGLCDNDEAVQDLVLTDVCPHTLGMEVVKEFGGRHIEPGFFDPIIDRNTTVPVSRSKSFSTLHPQQDMLLVQVFQGESRMTKDNRKIGELSIHGLTSKPGQKFPGAIEVRFTYDMNGILEVEVTVLSTGKVTTLIIEQRPGQMTKQQIAEALEKIRPLKTHLRDLLPNRARIERANRLYPEVTGLARDQLTGLLDAFEAVLELQDPQAIKIQGALLDNFLRTYFTDERPDAAMDDADLEDDPT